MLVRMIRYHAELSSLLIAIVLARCGGPTGVPPPTVGPWR
jgi:hypothetical protein